MTRTRLTSPSGAGACMENDLPCPAASPPPSAITDLINSRRCIVGRCSGHTIRLQRLADAATGKNLTRMNRDGASPARRLQESFLYTRDATTVAWGESEPEV